MSIIALDIGGTKIFAARYDNHDFSSPTETCKTPTPQSGRDTLRSALLSVVQKIWTKDVTAVGISWAGFVDSAAGLVVRSANINDVDGWVICTDLSAALGVRVFLENDARLFTYAEAQTRQQSDVVGVIIGTGVGMGIVTTGQLMRGAQGAAGELGHARFDATDVTLEQLIAGPALLQLLQPGDVLLSDFIREKRTALMPILQPRVDALARALAVVQLAYDPAVIVLGGSVGVHVFGQFLDEITQKVQAQLAGLPTAFDVQISPLHNAGALGAALWADKQMKNDLLK